MAKAAFNKKKNLFTSKLDLNLRKKLAKCYVWSMALYGAETWTLRATGIVLEEALDLSFDRLLMMMMMMMMFISILYTFRATMNPSSVELTVSIRYLVYVTLCGRPSGMQVGMKLQFTHSGTYQVSH